MTSFFPSRDTKASIPQEEERILDFWKKNHIFEKSVTQRNDSRTFRFFDGPPFATGLPHYGHILAGTIKDTIARYWTMKGYRVKRQWGWDCHGVPVEFQVEKEHGIGGKPGIEKMGVPAFNALCRSVVMECAEQWEQTVDRMGRFVDFENDYKTMDLSFMEGVWSVFARLWEKGLIYEGEKIVPYSLSLGSPLSNFEAGLNYKDIDDPAVTVEFFLEAENAALLGWTTTPWTLVSNLALGVNPEGMYEKATLNGKTIIAGKPFLEQKFPERKTLRSFLGKELVGQKYTPLFSVFVSETAKQFAVVADGFVSMEDGTGVVHLAPNFGEDDARVCADQGISFLKNIPIDENGYFSFSEEIRKKHQIAQTLEGLYFRKDSTVKNSDTANANSVVLEYLKENNLLFERTQIRHSYPHCWRTDSAMMYRSVHTWFVNVQKIKEQLQEENENIYWLTTHLKHGRFGKTLETAPDWAISRNRYWGTPLPVWKCDTCAHIEVIGSIKDLEEKAKVTIADIHRERVDSLCWNCSEKCCGKMKRIEEVLDCWFESGAMPHAQNVADFQDGKETLPADFIAEGLDQTRGWFYSLHVLGVGLFGKSMYKNVITNGLVLAEDGQKMSKSKKNYPDPKHIFNSYGADAMRFYLLSSPVIRSENLKFNELGVSEVLKSVLLPLQSAYQFFSLYANTDAWKPTEIIFVRHGEAQHNVDEVYSTHPENPHPLTEKGIAEVEKTASAVGAFDSIHCSPTLRTRQTADILLEHQGKNADEKHVDDRLSEVDFGELEGTSYIPFEKRDQNATVESADSISKRLRSFLDDMKVSQRGKKVVVVSHGDIYRHLLELTHGGSRKEKGSFLRFPLLDPAGVGRFFVFPETENESDRWILSELHQLLENFRKEMDLYNIESAAREIPIFIDRLNNWYLRRNRKRFWSHGMNSDKESGYETLYTVLYTLAKILAPIMPFFAEKLFRDLSGSADENSVHLSFLPFSEKDRINPKESQRITLLRNIIALCARIRAQKKIKLRQPLSRLEIAVDLEAFMLSEADIEIIAQEANVKKVVIIDPSQKQIEKIVKIQAKKVGKKLGKKTQAVIDAGKKGLFSEKEQGRIEILGEIFSPEEYEISFLCPEGVEAAALGGVVVFLETEISDSLFTEGIAREIIRALQESRKDQGFDVSDRIAVRYHTEDSDIQAAFTQFSDFIGAEVLAEEIIFAENSDLSHCVTVDGKLVKINLEKVK